MDETELRAELERLHAASYGWALACCARDPQEAEDVLQTVYWKILAGKARYDGRAEVKTWLFAVIRLTARDAQRKRALRRLLLLEYERDAARGPESESGDVAIERSEMEALFQRALAALPRRQQQVLELVFYHSLTIEQASQIMGVSLGSARTHYERGKQRLREWLNEAGEFDERTTQRRESPAVLP
jgi:RNA polymerase sigma-70 factor (ECF subfamily)